MCTTCQYGKAKQQPEPRPNVPLLNIDSHESGAITYNDLTPGACVSIDQYMTQMLGRLWTTRGSKKTNEMYKGRMIFIDHTSSLVHVTHQLTCTADETAQSKIMFEWMAAEHGVHVEAYQAVNGMFHAQEFIQQLKNQQI